MNNVSVSPTYRFDPFRLDIQNYTLSLLKEGYLLGLLTSQEVDKCQYGIMLLVKKLIWKHTGGSSSSVKLELAQTFLSSILFSIDAWLIQINDLDEAVQLLKEGNVSELYQGGVVFLSQYFNTVQDLFSEAKRKQLEINNTAYQMTMNQGLPEFLDQYDLIYHAHDHMANIDYPLLFDDMDIQGIYYIKQYLQILIMEIDFCRSFSPRQINNLLTNYGRVYQLDYREALVNVFEIVLSNCLFSILGSQDGLELSLSEYQVDRLQARLGEMDENEIATAIEGAIENIIDDFDIQNDDLKAYLCKYIDTLLPRLKSALKHGHLRNIAITDGKKETTPDIVLDLGNKMSDDDFRCLVESILECEVASQRVGLIFKSIHSLGDFIDVLEADCLFGDDWHLVFKRLGDMELSILARIVYIEQIRSDPHGFLLPREDLAEDNRTWQIHYSQFLRKLGKKRLQSINKHLHSFIHSKY